MLGARRQTRDLVPGERWLGWIQRRRMRKGGAAQEVLSRFVWLPSIAALALDPRPFIPRGRVHSPYRLLH